MKKSKKCKTFKIAEPNEKAIKILNMDKKRQMYHSLAFSFGLHVKQMKFIFQNKEPEKRQIDFLEQKVIKENNDSIFRDLKLLWRFHDCSINIYKKLNKNVSVQKNINFQKEVIVI